MPTYAVPPRETRAAPVRGAGTFFPIARIFCVGRNYAAHAREMGMDPAREPPFFFTKDADAYAPDGATIPYPSETQDFHHEVELVVAIGAPGFRVQPQDAMALVFGYGVGLDMTRRDLQADARKHGRPWSTAKNFPLSAPLSAIVPAAEIGDPAGRAITLHVNGALRQSGNTADVIWNVADTLAYLSNLYPLNPGDLVFTGTPEGVGPVVPGDVLAAEIAGIGTLTVTIGQTL